MNETCRAALIIKGEYVPCTEPVTGVALGPEDHGNNMHTGQAHGNADHEVIWCGHTDNRENDLRWFKPMFRHVWPGLRQRLEDRINAARKVMSAAGYNVGQGRRPVSLSAHTHDGPCPPHHANHEAGGR